MEEEKKILYICKSVIWYSRKYERRNKETKRTILWRNGKSRKKNERKNGNLEKEMKEAMKNQEKAIANIISINIMLLID